MPYALNYCSEKKESRLIDNGMREAVAFASDEDWAIDSVNSEGDYIDAFEKAAEVGVTCFDITSGKSTKTIESFRKTNKDSLLVIISDPTISPLIYMKPNIMASSLILKPLTDANVASCMKDVVTSYYNRDEGDSEDDSQKFCVEAKEGKTYYPYSKIVHFEAREKKIFLNTLHEEVGFYSTLDAIITQLPDYFVKCHRSFIVNTRKIVKIQSSQNLIYCEDDIVLPLSRSCKADVIKAMGVNKE